MAAESILKTYRDLVEPRLELLMPPASGLSRKVNEAMRYAALAPGKRLRPSLCLASCEAVGGTVEAALDPACAIEMVHCFSLIHDDLPAIDDDDLRRGRPTCHVEFGEAMAILAGDGLFALAFEVLARAPQASERVLEAVRQLASASGPDGLVGGEVVDVLSEGREVDEETLATIHAKKTGSLIAASCTIGGLFGPASDPELEALHGFGTHVGLAFQIADDILNETSTPEVLGKAAGSDRKRKKATYPALYGLEASKKAAVREVEASLGFLSRLNGPTDSLAALARYSVDRLH